MLYGLSCLATCTLIRLHNFGLVEIPVYRTMPIRSRASTLTSFHDKRSYNCRDVFCPGGPHLLFSHVPTSSGSRLLVICWDRAILRMVDIILGGCVGGMASSRVAALAYNLARPFSLLCSLVGTQRIVILFPFLRRGLLIILYINERCS